MTWKQTEVITLYVHWTKHILHYHITDLKDLHLHNLKNNFSSTSWSCLVEAKKIQLDMSET